MAALPDFPQISDETLRAIAARFRPGAATPERLRQVGLFNAVYALGGDLILRVPRQHPRFTDAIRNEAVAVPLARAAGVRTPSLTAFDDSLSLLPVPYSIYERVDGVVLEGAADDPVKASAAWRDLGHDLGLLHCGVARGGGAPGLVVFEDKTDPRPLPDLIAEAGYFTAIEARWLTAWLERLAPAALADVPQRFLHGDTQATNMMVDPSSLAYLAVIDWGGCKYADPAHDFAGVPLRAVPALLEGYRQVATAADETIEGRILWRHLQIALHQLRGQPQPTWSWGERPIGMLIETLRFFIDEQDPRWRQWGPPSRQ